MSYMKKHIANTLIILFLSYPLLAQVNSLNDITINEIFKKMSEAKELYNSGKSVKSEKISKEIENEMKELFPNGKIISSNENCKFAKKTNLNLSLERNRQFGLNCLNNNFSFYFEGSKDVSLSDKKTLTSIDLIEEFEDLADGELFEGRIMVISRRKNYSTFSISGNTMAAQTIVIYCKLLEVRRTKE